MGIHCRAVNYKQRLNLQRPVHLLIGVPPPCHFKLVWMLLCLTICAGACVGCYSPSSGVPVQATKVRVSPVASQCGAFSTKFLQWHSSVGLFQLSFSSSVPVYPASFRWVAQWYTSVHWVNQWHSSGIPVYIGPASVHWLRVRGSSYQGSSP